MSHRRAFCSSFERTIKAIKLCSSLITKINVLWFSKRQGQEQQQNFFWETSCWNIDVHTHQESRQILPGGGFKWQKYVKHNLSLHAHIFFLLKVFVQTDNLADDDDDDENYDKKCRNMCTLFIWSANSIILVSELAMHMQTRFHILWVMSCNLWA